MAAPVWSTGQVLTASDVNEWFVPRAAYKTSTQSVTSSTTFVNDTQLAVTVTASAVYDVTLSLIYDAAAGADIKLQFTVPSGGAVAGSVLAGLNNPAASGADDVTLGGSLVPGLGGIGSGTTAGTLWTFTLTTSSGGTLQLQWAQRVPSGTATRVFAGSKLVARRIG